MSDALKIAQHYFDASNKSDFAAIERLFTDTTTYSSATTGMYLGKADIMTMQRTFHGKFSKLHWKMNSAEEIKPSMVQLDYNFTGTLSNDEVVTSSGLEYVIVYEGKIQHIEIRNKV